MREFTSFFRLISATLMYFFLLTGFCTTPIQAQQDAVLEQIRSARQKGMVFRPYSLFTYQDALENVLPLRTALPEGAVLKINPDALRALNQQRPEALSLALPRDKNGQVFQMDLIRIDLHTPDFKLNTSANGPIAYETGIHYRGVLRNEAKTSVALSFSKDEVMGMIGFSESSNWVLGQLEGTSLRDAYTVYREDDLSFDKSFNCGSSEVSQEIQRAEHKLGELRGVTAVDKTVRVYFECEYDLVTEKGGAVGAANFINGIFNIVALLYQNEGINVVISEIFAWTTPDSYPTNSSSNTLTSFRNTRTSFNGDIAHLVSRGQPTGGGIAFRPGLCNGYGYAYSYVNSTYSAFPTYSWTANVITHEMGHNLGSPHTHDCAWNGNNTPLDGCGPAAGYTGTGSCPPLAAPTAPFKGTIMSYCHLLGGIGIDLNLGFGQQPGDLIRATVAAATCLSGAGSVCTTPTTAQLLANNVTANSATLAINVNGLVGYDWRYRLVGSSTWTDVASSASNTINITGLTSNSNYEFLGAVQCTAGGTWTTWSASKTFTTTSTVCTTPTIAQISASNIAPTTATLNCSVTGVVSYDWRYRLVGTSLWTNLTNTSTSSVNISGLDLASNYQFQVSLQCLAGGTWTAWSASSPFTTLTAAACTAPTTAQISASNLGTNTATLNCSVTGVVSYDWRYRLVGGITWTDLTNTSTNNTSLSSLAASSNYEFQVAVQCTVGGTWSPWSASKTFTTLAAACNAPSSTQISATGITAATATLNCSSPGVVSYDWRYRLVGSSTWTDLTNTSTSSTSLSSLVASSNYEFQVAVQCTAGGAWSPWSVSKTFTTLALVCSTPTTTQIAATSITSSTATLSCSLAGMVSYDWRYRLAGTSLWNNLTNTSAASVNISGLSAGGNYQFQVSVQCTAGGTWTAWSASKSFSTLAAACVAPTTAQISASNVGTNAATLNCALTGMANYDWRYRIVGSSSWIDLAAGATSSVSLNVLTVNTTYEFQVSVRCTSIGAWSAWSGSGTFTTISSQACGQPSIGQLSVSNLTTTSVQLNCTVTGAQAYGWQYRQVGSPFWTSPLNTIVGSTTIGGLSPGTQYEFSVRVNCLFSFTAWSPSAIFVTPAALEGSIYEPNLPQLDNLWLYPNPTRAELNVNYNLNTDSKEVSILVYDLSGRQIQKHNLGAQKAGAYQHKIQPNLTSGLFFLRVTTEKTSLVERFSVLR
ncbi:M12 family metallo-peptidase [Haliscomenobacter sp.]|uniref:M12 family metallo-peptidase n=1 Tax=Haliscomenobacter sp. TaxID=2717303 RepID=UPI003593AC7A